MTPFDDLALTWLGNLVEDFGLTLEQAAGILGNLGFESNGFRTLQEVNPQGGRGGFGCAQWTGPRRVAFEKWSADHNLDVASDEANYGFLRWELWNTQKHSIEQLKKTISVDAAVFTFGYFFERPGGTTKTHLPGFDARLGYARRAMALVPKPPEPAEDVAAEIQAAYKALGVALGKLVKS